MRNDIGASPDGVGDDFLLEIKTMGFGLNEVRYQRVIVKRISQIMKYG